VQIRIALCFIIGVLSTHVSAAGDCDDLTLPLPVVEFAYTEQQEQPLKKARITDLLARMLVEKLQLPDTSQSAANLLAKRVVDNLLTTSKSATELHTELAAEAASLCQIAARRSAAALAQPIPDTTTVIGKLNELHRMTLAAETGDELSNSEIMKLPFASLLDLHTGLFDCEEITNCPATLKKICSNAERDVSQCSRKVFAAIQRRKMVMEKSLATAKSIDAAATQTMAIETLFDDGRERYRDAVALETLRGPFYGLYAGPSFSLNENDGFDEGVEVFANFNTEASPGPIKIVKFSRGVFDVRFLSSNSFPSETKDGESVPVSVFKSTGELRLRARYQVHLTDWIGIEGGLGATSLISDNSSFTRIEPRTDIAMRFQTSYPDRAIGELMLGYSHDESWRRTLDTDGDLETTMDRVVEKQFDRIFVEGSLLFPNVDLGGFSLGARLSANFPVSGSTQSELRASILLYYPFNAWLEKFRPSVAKPAN